MTRAYSSRARKTKETHILDHTSIAWEETLLHHQHWTRAARRIFIFQNNKKLHTRRSIVPVPCFQDTRRARPPGLKTIISSDVMFLFTRLGWGRTGMGDCRQKIMFIWFDCNKISRRKHNIHCSLQHQREDAQFVKNIFTT